MKRERGMLMIIIHFGCFNEKEGIIVGNEEAFGLSMTQIKIQNLERKKSPGQRRLK